MSYISIQTRAQVGLDSPRVNVEVHLANGLPCFNIVGLPELAVKESRECGRPSSIHTFNSLANASPLIWHPQNYRSKKDALI